MAVSIIPPGFRFYKTLIGQVAQRHGLDPAMVAAVCWQESGFNTDGFRFEALFFNRYLKAKPEYVAVNPRRVSSSYGLLQVMHPVAVERGMSRDLPPEALFVPEIGLEWGCTHLKYLMDWAVKGWPERTADHVLAVLASYNGGKGANTPVDSPLRNGKYAREVMARIPVMRSEYARP